MHRVGHRFGFRFATGSVFNFTIRTGLAEYYYLTYLQASPLLAMLPFPEWFPIQSKALVLEGFSSQPSPSMVDVDTAYKHFFRRLQLKKEGKWKAKLGFPVFKKKSKGIGSFRLTGSIHVFSYQYAFKLITLNCILMRHGLFKLVT